MTFNFAIFMYAFLFVCVPYWEESWGGQMGLSVLRESRVIGCWEQNSGSNNIES